jgi:RNA polymerase primary sigma factor
MKRIEIKAEEIKKAYEEFKNLLTVKENEIITRYYGLGDNVRHTLAEIGGVYGVTRERIRQIKVVALTKLKVKK